MQCRSTARSSASASRQAGCSGRGTGGPECCLRCPSLQQALRTARPDPPHTLQCSRYHPVSAFVGTQRSCQQQLARHAERRRLLRRARKGRQQQQQPVLRSQSVPYPQQQSWQPWQPVAPAEDSSAKRQRSMPAPLPLPPLPLSQALQPFRAPLSSAGVPLLALDRSDSGGSSDSLLGLPGSAPNGAPAGLAAVVAAASDAWPQPGAQDQPEQRLTALLLHLTQHQGGAQPAPPPPPVQPAAVPTEQQLVSLLIALLEQQQQAAAQQRAEAGAAILQALLQNTAAPPSAPAPDGVQLLAAAPAAAALPLPPAPPTAEQSLAALLAQLVGGASS